MSRKHLIRKESSGARKKRFEPEIWLCFATAVQALSGTCTERDKRGPHDGSAPESILTFIKGGGEGGGDTVLLLGTPMDNKRGLEHSTNKKGTTAGSGLSN